MNMDMDPDVSLPQLKQHGPRH
ncbi:Heat stress transcription factor A-6b [Zea mays]|nr:Heat stress transcription factor A-6b [Zea mays]